MHHHLKAPNFEKYFILYNFASDDSLAAVLTQKEEGGDEYVGDIYHLTHSFWSIWPSYTTILSIIDLINIGGALNVIS